MRNGKRHVHVVNDSGIPELFLLTQDEVDAAIDRVPDLRGKAEVTVALDDDGFEEAMRTADVLLGWDFRPRAAVSDAAQLRWIHIIGAGVEHLMPLDWLRRDIAVTNSSGVHAALAGDFIAGALLMLNSHIPEWTTNQRAHTWRQKFSVPIRGKVVLIVGVGTIGAAGARAAKRLGLTVYGIRRTAGRRKNVDRMLGPDQLDQVLPEVDFVVVTAASTSETYRMFGARQFELMGPEAGFVNVARADIVDHEALAASLRANRLGGAILDVFEQEPLPESSPLWDCPNLIVTPHISSDPADYNERMLAIFTENLLRLHQGRRLRNRVSRSRGY